MLKTIIEILAIVFPVIGTIIVAIIEKNAAKEREVYKAKIEKDEARAVVREKESRLSMKMSDAILQLSIVTANAVTGGHNNGNIEKAKEAVQVAQNEYALFLQEIAAHEVSKR